jgi:methionyl aminopeptidase
MIIIKTPAEIEKLRAAGRIVALTHQELKKHIVPGVTTFELNRIAEDFIKSQGAYPSFKGLYGFPGAVCISVNEELIHGIPSKKKVLKEGDIVTIDIGACLNGYHGDSAWTYPVGKIDPNTELLLKVTEQSLYEGLKMAVANNRVGDIGHAVQEYAEKFGYSVVREYTGHGVGRKVHEDPYVPNYGFAHTGARLVPGMVIAVEPMINAGSRFVNVLSDDWTVVTRDGKMCAHFEHTVAITPNGDCEILTKL